MISWPLLLLLTHLSHYYWFTPLCSVHNNKVNEVSEWRSEQANVSERTNAWTTRTKRTDQSLLLVHLFILRSPHPPLRSHRHIVPTHQVCSPCSLPWFRGYLIIRNEVNQWERWFNLFPLLVHFPCCRSHRSHSFTPPLLIRRVNQHERWNVTTRWTQLIHWDRGDGNSNTSQWNRPNPVNAWSG